MATLDAARRVDVEENARWRFLRDQLVDGHTAAALVHSDLSEDSPDGVCHDDAVQVEVLFAVGRSQPSLATLDLAAAVRLAASGAQILELGAPQPRPVTFHAIANVEECGQALVRDLRGFGRLAMSEEPFGDWWRGYAQRSGVPGVNKRRKDAAGRLRKEYGAEAARTILISTVAMAMVDHTERHRLGNEWIIVDQSSPLTGGPKATIADSIVDALSVETYGATRPHLLKARAWQLRLTSERFDADDARGADLVHEDQVRPTTGKAQLMSDWSLRQGSEQPTETVALGLVDGTVTVGGVVAAGLPVSDLIQAWRQRGLTERQMQVLFGDWLGLTDQEIGDALQIARSTVANTLAAARKKIWNRA